MLVDCLGHMKCVKFNKKILLYIAKNFKKRFASSTIFAENAELFLSLFLSQICFIFA